MPPRVGASAGGSGVDSTGVDVYSTRARQCGSLRYSDVSSSTRCLTSRSNLSPLSSLIRAAAICGVQRRAAAPGVQEQPTVVVSSRNDVAKRAHMRQAVQGKRALQAASLRFDGFFIQFLPIVHISYLFAPLSQQEFHHISNLRASQYTL